MKKAVFLDRDGVLIDLVVNPLTGEFEPPHTPLELTLIPGSMMALRCLQEAGFLLFLVSNQPDYAKGKVRLEDIRSVHARFAHLLGTEGIRFQEFYYCYHHPSGKIPDYSYDCECRKPKPYFIEKAVREYRLDVTLCWMVGDRDSDIACGKAAGTRTILIEEARSSAYRHGIPAPDYKTANLKDAATIILRT